MKKAKVKSKNATAKFNGDDFAPMNQLRSGIEHLNYQIADFRARNSTLIASENRQMQAQLDRLQKEEEKAQWKDHFREKFRQKKM